MNPSAEKSGLIPNAARMPLNRPSGAMRKIHKIVIAAELAIAGK